MHFRPEEDVIRVLQVVTKAPITRWQCPCGCATVVFLARDPRGIFVAPTIQPLAAEGLCVVVGLSTKERAESYVAHLTRTLAPTAVESFSSTFWELWQSLN